MMDAVNWRSGSTSNGLMSSRSGMKKKSEGASQETVRFSSGRDIHLVFKDSRNVSEDSIRFIRNRLSIRSNEAHLSSDDERIVLVRDWLEISPGAEDLFDYLNTNVSSASLAICLSVLSCALTITSAHFDGHSVGLLVVRKLLTPRWIQRLQSILSGSHADSILSALKLLNSVSSFAGGRERKALLDTFSWDVKVFHRLLSMRRKGKAQKNDGLQRPDIRTLCLTLILSFIRRDSSVQTKITFLEQRQDLFLSLFKGLSDDPYAVVRNTLEEIWTNIWQDPKIKRTVKISLFGERTVQHLLKLYEHATPDDSNTENIAADLVHHFLLGITSHRGVGICFPDNGWYPRSTEEDDQKEEQHSQKTGRIFNKILSNVLKMLKVNEDPRQQELALKILAACPELVAAYLPSSGLTLEPRISSRWLVNVAFLGSVISLPTPFESFLLPTSQNSSSSSSRTRQFRPIPPPLSTLVENILPSMNLKTHFSKGLQSHSGLVQHATAVTLAKCLQKCRSVLEALNRVRLAQQEDEITGQWTKQCQELRNEVRKRLPDFQVIIAFSQQKSVSEPAGKGAVSTKQMLLAEIAQRLLYLYHHCVPSMVAEANFEVGKSLQSLWHRKDSQSQPDEQAGFPGVQLLLVLRMLGESTQFSWSAKSGGQGYPSNIAILLSLYARMEEQALRKATQSILERSFASGPLFEHNPSELYLWLAALPSSIRGSGVEAPDGAPLTDEIDSIIGFLEDCFQRCHKNTYRYLEDLQKIVSGGSELEIHDDFKIAASPLIMTFLEQLAIKARQGNLSSSDLLTLATYLRKLATKLVGISENLRLSQVLSQEISKILLDPSLCESHPVIKAALTREVNLLRLCVSHHRGGRSEDEEIESSSDVEAQQQFLTKVENVALHEQTHLNRHAAFELVDWLRLLNQELRIEELERLVKAINIRYQPALRELWYHISPCSTRLWELLSKDAHVNISQCVDFDWLLVHACEINNIESNHKEALSRCLEQGIHTVFDFKRYLGFVFLKICLEMESTRCAAWFDITVLLLERAKLVLGNEQLQDIKVHLLQGKANSTSILRNPNVPRELSKALDHLVSSLLESSNKFDRAIAEPICLFWADFLDIHLASGSVSISNAMIWLRFMPSDRILSFASRCAQIMAHDSDTSELAVLLDNLLSIISHMEPSVTSNWSSENLRALIKLRSTHSLSNLDPILAKIIRGYLPLGHSGIADHWHGECMKTVIKLAEACWASRFVAMDESIDVTPLFSTSLASFDFHVSSIFEGLLYRTYSARRLFFEWLKIHPEAWSIRYISRPLHAYLDIYGEDEPNEAPLSEDDESVLARACLNVLREVFEDPSEGYEVSAVSCGHLALCRLKTKFFSESLREMIDSLVVDRLHIGLVGFSAVLDKHDYQRLPSLSASIVNHILKATTRHLSDAQVADPENRYQILLICGIMDAQSHIPGELAEPVIASAIRQYLGSPGIMRLAGTIFKLTTLKPINVNRLLQSIVQHAQLHRDCAPGSSARDEIVKLLYALFHAYPENTCQPSHIQPLVQLYQGTLSPSDRRLISIFRLFEKQGKGSVSSLLTAWSPTNIASPCQTFYDCVIGLDSSRVFRTCLEFPNFPEHHEDDRLEEIDSWGKEFYNPYFVILVFCQSLIEGPPDSGLSWVQLFRSNIVSLIVRCLSSPENHVRYLALVQLRLLWKTLQASTMQEKQQVVHILGLLRNLYLKDAEAEHSETAPRLPAFTTLILAHAFRAVFYPSNFVYPLISRFLLQRPALDPTDVPMLYNMLFSSSDDWKRERAWILRFLSDGMLSSEDWGILKRRHTWDLLASLFQRSVEDKQLRRSILDVLATLTCHKHPTTTLIIKHSLIHWLELQLISFNMDEAIAWTKIIENIAVVVDQGKLDRVTRRSWRTGLLRCLISLTQGADLCLLSMIARTTLRLSMSIEQETREIHIIVKNALGQLIHCEASLAVPLSLEIVETDTPHGPPHGRSHLYEVGGHNSMSINTWGATVDLLWSITMSCDCASEVWDDLTCRLLIWRSMNQASVVGEWARREMVRNMLARRPRSAGR